MSLKTSVAVVTFFLGLCVYSVHAGGPKATDWVSPNDNGKVRGPIYVPEGTMVVEVQVKEQTGHGVVDMRFGYRKPGKVGLEYSGWSCNNSNGQIRKLKVPDGRIVAGIDAKEQAGFGITDIRLYLRDSKGSALDEPFTTWACNNKNQNRIHEGRTPAKQIVTGFEVREQAGFGIINIRTRYVAVK